MEKAFLIIDPNPKSNNRDNLITKKKKKNQTSKRNNKISKMTKMEKMFTIFITKGISVIYKEFLKNRKKDNNDIENGLEK